VRREELTAREEKILSAIVETYIRSARPVSSGAVVRRGSLKLSSATVRNVMRSLEDRGLIEQPHTSAGRIPADRGYRYYVDRLMGPATVSNSDSAQIRAGISVLGGRDIATIVTGVSRTLSELCKQLAVGLEPAVEGGIIDRVELVHLEEGRCLVVAGLRSGQTRSALVECREKVSESDVAAATELLNDWLDGLSIAEASEFLKRKLKQRDCPFRDLIRGIHDRWDRIFHLHDSERVHYEGARYILRNPEFAGDSSLLGEILDSEEALADLVRRPGGREVVVIIGHENRRRKMEGVSLVVGSYRVGETIGRIGVIGPTRMQYRRLVGVVDQFSRLLDDLFSSSHWQERR
jgi:heat-inducible transcriptional repressor